MSFRALAAVSLLLAVCAAPADAQQFRLEFKDGRVSLNAQNTPIRAILAEWARMGGATIVNGDRVPGAPVTLELIAVPERQALDTLLRGAAAYMLAPRRPGTAGVSAFDRILILPTSTAPRNPAPAPTPAALGPRPILPRPPVVQNPNVPGVVVADNPGDDAEVVGQPLVPQPRVVQRPPQPIAAPVEATPPDADDTPSQPAVVGGATAPSPTNPFGIPAGSSMRPGVIAPVPQQPNPNQRPQQP